MTLGPVVSRIVRAGTHYPAEALRLYTGACGRLAPDRRQLRGSWTTAIASAWGGPCTAPPPLTTYGVTLLGGDQQFSIEMARCELGYAPEFDVKWGVTEGLQWYLNSEKVQAKV